MKSENLDVLAKRICLAHENYIAASKRGIEYALRCGDLLLQAKERAGHGNWLPWLAENCPAISDSTAKRYMRLARGRAELEAKSVRLTDLTLQAAADLLAPEPVEQQGFNEEVDDGAGELTATQRDQILAMKQNFGWGAEAIAKALKLPVEAVAAFLKPKAAMPASKPEAANDDEEEEESPPTAPTDPEPDEIDQALAAEAEQAGRASAARQKAFYAAAATFINSYRADHLDLEWAEIDAVFKRVHAEIVASRRDGLLALPEAA